MYVCRPSWNCPWNRAIQLGLGEGPIRIVGPMSQPFIVPTELKTMPRIYIGSNNFDPVIIQKFASHFITQINKGSKN